MSKQYLRLVREELKTPSLLQITPQRLESIIQTLRKTIVDIHTLDETSEEILISFFKRIQEDIDILSKVRSIKIITDEKIDESSVDVEIAKMLITTLRAEKLLFSPFILRHGDRLFYLFNRDCGIGDRFYRRNQVALISTREFTLAEILSCGQVLVDPVYRSLLEKSILDIH